jgi:hypothetical protein
MSFTRWLKYFRVALAPGRANRSHRRRSLRAVSQRPRLELLDDRCTPSFSPAVNYPVGGAPLSVVTADFNNDSVLDIAVANSGGNNVSVLLGNADGTFRAAQNSATGYLPRCLAVGDFNKDGKLDLATANAGDVSVLVGNGNGTFGTPANINTGYSPSSVAVGDFNADGNLDLGVASSLYYPPQPGDPYYGGGSDAYYANYANVLLGNGAGTMTYTSSTYMGGNYAYESNYQQPAYTAAVADFNTDGRADFVSTNSHGSYASVLLANLNGTLSYAQYWGIGFNSLAVLAKDVSGDGKADLVATNGDGVTVRLGNGLGSFGSAQNYVVGSQPHSLALADFNKDGTIDVVTGNGGAGTVSVLLGTGAGAFKPPLHDAAGPSPVGVAVGDFNGDGRWDVATADRIDQASVLFNDGLWLSLKAPSISINDVTVTEGNTGSVAATFTVSLNAGSAGDVIVQYATADGNATVDGGDYQAAAGTLTFRPGESLSQTVTVLVNGDRSFEYDESFTVQLSDVTNAFVADPTGVGTIRDDEPFIGIESYVSGREGNTGTTLFAFTVTLSGNYDVPVTVDYATADLSADEEYWYGPGAKAGVDYVAASGTVTFHPGQSLTQAVTVEVIGDRIGEWSESFFVNLSNPSYAQLTSTQSWGIIEDDEPYVSISGGGTVVEGNSGTKSMTFTVTLETASDEPVTVTYATADSSATSAGGDYQSKTGTLTFNPGGPRTQDITVLVNGDRSAEYDESFIVNLTGATGANLGNTYGYVTIQDDEPRVSINSVSIKEGNSGTTLMIFTVSLSAAYDQAVSVNYATSDGSAIAGEDYVATSGTLTIAAGQMSKTFAVTIKGDKKKELDESFSVFLSNPSSYAFIWNGYGYGTIVNDDGGSKK